MEDQKENLFNWEFLNKWHHNYGKLKPYIEQPPLTMVDLDEELAQWVSVQRRIRHMLPKELKGKLAELSFVLEDRPYSWNSMYKQLALFVQETGHSIMPNDEKHEQLKDWLIRQVIHKRLLTESQFQLLDKLEVDWDMPISREHRWIQMYGRLKDFHSAFGHCRVPQRWPKDKQLALWVAKQRRLHAQGRLRGDRKQRLQELEFTWSIQEVYDAQWEGFFQQLASFSRRHGHCRVPCRHEKLVSWMERQRLSRKRGQLPQDRLKRLEGVGFTWSSEDMKRRSWEERYRQLKEYNKKHGHSFVPVNYRENRSLGIWVATQRGLEAKGKLPEAKKKKLDQLGFVWSKDTQHKLKSVHDKQWSASFEKLKAYRQEHATCQVSLSINPVLQRWTRWQRRLFYEGRLSQERIGRLDEIGFPWNVQEGYWLKMYEALAGFKIKWGHTRVPFQWAPNPQLSAWVYRMRLNKQALTSQKVELLDQIGFDWYLSRRTVVPWKVMYDRLVAFKLEHGHTRVPVKWHENLKLGRWVSRMRRERGKLNPERVSLLEAIGFVWECRFACKKNIRTNG